MRVTTAAKAEWIWAPPGERHWHGAAPGHDFTYTSIQAIDPATGTYADW